MLAGGLCKGLASAVGAERAMRAVMHSGSNGAIPSPSLLPEEMDIDGSCSPTAPSPALLSSRLLVALKRGRKCMAESWRKMLGELL